MRALLIVFFSIVSTQTFAQRLITGTVKDANNSHLLPGASISVKSTNRGTTAGNDGRFSISAGDSDILVIQNIGYSTKEVLVGSESNFDIELYSSAKDLNAVTIVGSRRVGRSSTESP